MNKILEDLMNNYNFDPKMGLCQMKFLDEIRVKAKDLAEEEEKFLEANKKGGCLEFATVFWNRIKKIGFHAYLGVTSILKDGVKEQHCVVIYKELERWYVADPSESVRTGMMIIAVPLEIFAFENNIIMVLDPLGEHKEEEVFNGFLGNPLHFVTVNGPFIF